MFWYSTALRQAAQNLSETKKWLRFLYTQTGVKEDIEKAKQRRSAAIIKLREVQQNDRQYRDEMLIELGKKSQTMEHERRNSNTNSPRG